MWPSPRCTSLLSAAGYGAHDQASTGTSTIAPSRAPGDSPAATLTARTITKVHGAGSGVQVVTQIITIQGPQGPTPNESGPPSQFVIASGVAGVSPLGEALAAEPPAVAAQAVSL